MSVSALAGDEVIVTSTDFDWRQAETFKILRCDECANNEIRLDGEPLSMTVVVTAVVMVMTTTTSREMVLVMTMMGG